MDSTTLGAIRYFIWMLTRQLDWVLDLSDYQAPRWTFR